MRSVEELEKIIGYEFKDKTLLITALTHSSYLNENNLPRERCNERIEFLGDAVLELVSSDFLYKTRKDLPEGELTKLRASLVCEPTLAIDAKALSLSEFLLLGKGEDKNNGRYRDSIVSDALEALIGAIYLDSGIKNAADFILKYILSDYENKTLYHDAKTALQEIMQEKVDMTPEYEIVGQSGPDHDKVFDAIVRVGDEIIGRGTGRTKKSAQQDAALKALQSLRG